MRWAALLLLPLLAAPAEPPVRASFDFRYEVLPLLHRQGCASAYCHGSATGRGGFKLSLFASDPAADHRAITEDLGGRRLDLGAPAHSLLLRKPTLDLKHGGGVKLREEDAAYATLLEWITAGAPYRSGAAQELTGLQLTRDGDRLRATATFGGGAAGTRDVTALCTFTSSDDRVAAVDEAGRITTKGAGEAWVFARYANQSARLAVRKPFAAGAAPAADIDHPLDRLWLARLAELGLTPGEPAPDHAVARRLYLDLTGRLPTPAEVHACGERGVAATAAALLQTEAFAETFGRHLAEWFEIPLEPGDRPSPRDGLFRQQHLRLVEAVRRGDTLHAIVERLLLEDRQLIDRDADPRDRAELAGRAFLGIRIGCARCHNSPVDRWEQGEHLAFSALFADERPDPRGGMRQGKLFDPETGAEVEPRLLPVEGGGAPREADHRRAVAAFILRGGHRMLERNFANRVFAALLGAGLVEPLDDHRLSNPARHEALLAHLTEVAEEGDLRRLVTHIVTSRLYRTTSARATEEGDASVAFFARRASRPMPAHTFERAVEAALRVPARGRLSRSPLARQLAVLNSEFLHGAVRTSPVIRGIAAFAADERAVLDDLFRVLLSRPPRAREVEAFLPQLRREGGPQDLAFALLASREFGSIR